MTDVARVLEVASPEIIMGDDGYYIWWPEGNNGAHAAWHLRVIADELDRRNADWDAHIQKAFG